VGLDDDYSIFITYTSSKHANYFNHMDKILHLGSYGLAMILTTLAYQKIHHYKSISLLFTYSLMIEVAQLFVVNRYFEVADLVANLMGILLAIYLMKLLRPTRLF